MSSQLQAALAAWVEVDLSGALASLDAHALSIPEAQESATQRRTQLRKMTKELHHNSASAGGSQSPTDLEQLIKAYQAEVRSHQLAHTRIVTLERLDWIC